MDKFLGFATPCHPNYVKSSDISELSEEDVWEHVSFSQINQGAVKSTPTSDWAGSSAGKSSRGAHSVCYNRSSRTVYSRGSDSRLGNDSLRDRSRIVSESAPMRVPDWTKFGRVNTAQKDQEDEDEKEGALKLPPHEIVARDCARSPLSPFSVIEGAGRTLKGRDLNNVRAAVWRCTGFPG